MPETKPKTRGGGPKPYRTFHTSITFRISPTLHDRMKIAAGESNVRVEDVYREAVLLLLDRRERKPVAYLAAPRARACRVVIVKMEDDLKARIQAAMDADEHTRSDFFETATSLYLGLTR